jgi:HEAT repeat protein
MDKLVEREVAPRASLSAAPAYAVQFFLIPLAVVAVTILVYLGFRSLITDERSAQDYLLDIRTGSASHRWPAAYELSRLMSDPDVARDPTLGPAVIKAFEASKEDDPRLRRYLALAIGRLPPPLPTQAVPTLIGALHDADSETVISAIWALGSLGDPSVVPQVADMYQSPDAGIRKMTVYALGALPGDTQLRVLATALNDSAADVQWNAAVALARHRHHEGVPVLQRMLDRDYVARVVNRTGSAEDDVDPVGEVMISALQAIAALQETSLRVRVTDLSRGEPNLRVRQVAMETLKALGPA